MPRRIPSNFIALGPMLDRRAWALISLFHLGVMALAAITLRDELRGTALAQFIVSRGIGSASFVTGAWLLVRVLDHTHRLRHAAVRVAARIAAVLGVAAVMLAAFVPVLLLAERALGWRGARSRDDLMGQFDANVIVFTVYALVYWVWRRRVVALHLIAQAERSDAALKAARLHALALELQPHFLHNTLNGIAQLVRDDPDAAETMLVTLGDLLRTTLSDGRSAEHPLADELARLRMYLDLQGMRFGDRLHVEYHVPPEAHAAWVPTMLLQPLVENALDHGIGRRTGPGTLTLHAEVSDVAGARRLILRVRDDGAGLGADPIREGIGLRNTRERLDTLYPGAHTFTVHSRAAGGAEAVIELPWHTSDRASA
jgi:GNAT superfamily N-acetyltransferase